MKDYRKKYPLLFEDDTAVKMEKRYHEALQVAKTIANILKKEFQAKEVVLFGSLLNKDDFHLSSDIDIAEKGIPPERFYAAYGAITGGICDFKIDLVDMEDCKDYMKAAIRKGEIL